MTVADAADDLEHRQAKFDEHHPSEPLRSPELQNFAEDVLGRDRFAVVHYGTKTTNPTQQLTNKLAQCGGELRRRRNRDAFEGEMLLLISPHVAAYRGIVDALINSWYSQGWDDSASAVGLIRYEGEHWVISDIVRCRDCEVVPALIGGLFPDATVHNAKGFFDAPRGRIPPTLGEQTGLLELDRDKIADRLVIDLHLPYRWIRELIDLALDRRSVVLYGPPGTGKTFIARRLAQMLQPNERLVRLVQLHPSYGYEHFFEGYRPGSGKGLSLELSHGPLRRLVNEMGSEDRGILILDEMNRGNLPKIFGELYFLLEYREEAIELMYADAPDGGEADRFSLPDGLILIGAMNTSDRSVSVVDQALRRRFAFVGLFTDSSPLAPDGHGHRGVLGEYLRDREDLSWLPDMLDRANLVLDRDAAIGPSYFLRGPAGDLDIDGVARIWAREILPTIEERLASTGYDVAEFAFERLYDAIRADD